MSTGSSTGAAPPTPPGGVSPAGAQTDGSRASNRHDEPAQVPPAARPGNKAVITLAVLAVGWTLWATQDLVLPILLAMFFALIGNPFIRLLRALHVPRALAAVLLVGAGLTAVGTLGWQMAEPAGAWIKQMPRQMREVGPKVRKMIKPVHDANRAAEHIAKAAGTGRRDVQLVRTELNTPYRSLIATPKLVASIFAVVLLTLFFMIFGGRLQQNAIALLPNRQKKRLTKDILQSIEREMSRYVLTISAINAALGAIMTAILYWGFGLSGQEALLWGVIVAILNYAPYVGPLIGVALMLLLGLILHDSVLPSLLPAVVYLALHTIEGQIITPLILGKRMALSPLVLMLALLLFGWIWGIIGLLLAVPLLVCIKIVLARLDGLQGWAKILE